MKHTMLHMLIALMFRPMYAVDDAGGGASDAGDKGADKGGDLGGDKGELSLRDTLEGEFEIAEKGVEKPDELSAAAKRLAAARKTTTVGDDKTKSDDAAKAAKATADATAAKAKREAEIAKLPADQQQKARDDDAKKEADAKAAAAAASSLEAPAHWPAADKEMFAKQTPEAKAWLLNRHKAMETDYTKKMESVAPMRRMQETLDDVFKPYEEEMRQSGVSREQAIRELVGLHARIKADPVAGLKYLAQVSNVDLKELTAEPSQENAVIESLRKELAQVRSRLDGGDTARNAEQLNAHLQSVQQFADEKDAQGQPLRPYFDEVAKDVAALIRVARSNKEQLSLQDAYDRAIYANPTTRAKVLAAESAKTKAADEAERKRKADAARLAAGGNISGEGSSSTVEQKSDGSVRGDLEQAFASVGDRV